MPTLDSDWVYGTRVLTDPAAPPAVGDSSWVYGTRTVANPIPAANDSNWVFGTRQLLRPGSPQLMIDGTQKVVGWFVRKAGSDAPVLSWAVMSGGAAIPLAYRTGGWSAPTYTVGADPVGSQVYTIPSSNVIYLSTSGNDASNGLTVGAPKATLQAAITAVPAGGTIVVRAGSYHQGNIETSKSFTLQNYPGEAVWFDGAITFPPAWTQSGSVWTAPYTLTYDRNLGKSSSQIAFWTGQPQRYVVDQVWLDNTRLYAVADGTTPGPGQFSVNQSTDTLTIGSNPAGKTVRVVDLNFLFAGSGATTVRGIGIRRYAPRFIEYRSQALVVGAGSLVEQVTIEHSSLGALSMNGNGIIIRRSTFQDCGHTIASGDQTGQLLFERNMIRRGNRNGFDPEPTTAGLKITRVFTGVDIRFNLVQDVPNGTGIWWDTAVWRSKLIGNEIIGTSVLGASYRMKGGIGIEGCDGGFIDGVQYFNYIVGNRVSDCRQGGCNIADNGWVKIWNNQFSAAVALWLLQDYRENLGDKPSTEGTALQSPWHTRDVDIVNNILIPEGQFFTQLRAQCNNDAAFKIAGGAMISRLRSNWFRPAGSGLMAYLSNAAGTAWSSRQSLASLESTSSDFGGPLGSIMSGNTQGDVAPTAPGAPIEADVAAAAGIPSGLVTAVGPIWPRLVPAT